MVMNHELERMWKEVIMVCRTVSSPIFAKRNLMKIVENHYQDSQSLNRPSWLGDDKKLQNESNCS
jgi:hypothetical protein